MRCGGCRRSERQSERREGERERRRRSGSAPRRQPANFLVPVAGGGLAAPRSRPRRPARSSRGASPRRRGVRDWDDSSPSSSAGIASRPIRFSVAATTTRVRVSGSPSKWHQRHRRRGRRGTQAAQRPGRVAADARVRIAKPAVRSGHRRQGVHAEVAQRPGRAAADAGRRVLHRLHQRSRLAWPATPATPPARRRRVRAPAGSELDWASSKHVERDPGLRVGQAVHEHREHQLVHHLGRELFHGGGRGWRGTGGRAGGDAANAATVGHDSRLASVSPDPDAILSHRFVPP